MTKTATITDDYTPISSSVPADEIAKTQQNVRRQTDGLGRCVGSKAEFTLVGPLKPGGAEILERGLSRRRPMQPTWKQAGHGTRCTYLPYQQRHATDVRRHLQRRVQTLHRRCHQVRHAFDRLHVQGRCRGVPGPSVPEAVAFIQKYIVEASVWYTSSVEATVRDVARGQNVLKAFGELLDAAKG